MNMIKRIASVFLFFFLAVLAALGAITERYVTASGSDTYANSTNPGTPMSLSTAITSAVAGDRINIQVGTYSRAASDTVTNAGTVTSPIIWRGYSATIGDGNLGRSNSNGALITTNMPLISFTSNFKITTSAFNIIECINFTGASITGQVTMGADSVAKSCKVVNSSTNAGAIGVGMSTGGVLYDCDVELTGASGGACAVDAAAGSTKVIASRIKGGPTVGVKIGLAASMSALVGNVIFAQTGVGVSAQATGSRDFIYGNTIVGGAGKGIDIITGSTLLRFIGGNMITDNATYGIEYNSTANAAFEAYNRYRDNTTANRNNTGDWITATSYANITSGNGTSDYTAAGSADYSLISTSPAKGAGWFSFLDIGALQRQEPAGGGGAQTRIPSIGL